MTAPDAGAKPLCVESSADRSELGMEQGVCTGRECRCVVIDPLHSLPRQARPLNPTPLRTTSFSRRMIWRCRNAVSNDLVERPRAEATLRAVYGSRPLQRRVRWHQGKSGDMRNRYISTRTRERAATLGESKRSVHKRSHVLQSQRPREPHAPPQSTTNCSQDTDIVSHGLQWRSQRVAASTTCLKARPADTDGIPDPSTTLTVPSNGPVQRRRAIRVAHSR